MSKNRDFSTLHYELPPNIARCKEHGDLKNAIRLIDLALERNDRPELAPRLRCERIRLERLPYNYNISLDQAKAMMREGWPDMTDEQFQALLDNKRIDWRYIDGVPSCHNRFLNSVRFYDKEAPGLKRKPEDTTDRDEMLRRMKEEGGLAARITLKHTIRPKTPSAGKSVQAWLPFPSPCYQQSEIEVLECTEGAQIAPEDAPQRTVYWDSSETDTFSITYRYLIRAPYVDVSALTADPVQPDFCLEEEAPHIRFTPYLREIAARVTEGCTDPLSKARAIYDYITENMDYRFQPDYFQLDPIAELCARELRGDCGMFAVFFITLCRIVGIPAQWQSGLSVEPTGAGSHDWAMFYVAPHGWLWADCSYGSSSRRRGEPERRAHYFGNLDPQRMAANHRFAAPLTPPDPQWRHDPTDNQQGEMVVDGEGLYGGDMERKVDVVSFEYLPY